MSRCEMCGTEESTLTTVKISQAELDVCDDCKSMGTEIDTGNDTGDTDTKYSTSSTPSQEPSDTGTDSESTQTSSTQTTSHSHSSPPDEEEAAPLMPGYGEVLRDAREERGMSVAEVADELNRKEAHLRKVEKEDRQPTEELQQQLESYFDISLSEDVSVDQDEKSSTEMGLTIGDVVNRKES